MEDKKGDAGLAGYAGFAGWKKFVLTGLTEITGLTGLTFLTVFSHAATYYVAPTGNDSNSCSAAASLATPKRTIASGLGCVVAGDRLLMRAGSYAESIDSNGVRIPGGTSWTNAPVIAAYPGNCGSQSCETVTIRSMNLAFPSGQGQATGSYVIFDGLRVVSSGGDAISFWGAAHHIRIQNCEATGATGQRMGINIQPGNGGGGFNEILNCKVHHNGDCSVQCTSGMVGHGLYVAMNNNLIDGIESYNNGHLGLQVYSEWIQPSNNVVRNSVFHDNGRAYTASGQAIAVGVGTGNQIYNNVIYNERGGITVAYNGTNTQVYNNTIYNTSGPGIEIRSTTGAQVRNNIAYQTGGINNTATNTTLSNNLTTNPPFANPASANFRLTSASVDAINRGFTVSAVTTDFDGVSRPQGSAYDIGAFEFGGTPPPPPPPTGSACDLNSDSTTNITDVQLCANQAIGAAACGSGDVNRDSVCNVIDVQRVVNAALGGACVAP